MQLQKQILRFGSKKIAQEWNRITEYRYEVLHVPIFHVDADDAQRKQKVHIQTNTSDKHVSS